MDDLDDELDNFNDGEIRGDGFNPGRESPVSSASNPSDDQGGWNRARRDWSVAAIAALGYLTIFAAILLGLNGVWPTLPRVVHGVVLAILLAAAYAVAAYPKFQSNTELSRLFYAIGAVVLLFALALCSPDAPKSLAGDGFWEDFADSIASVSGRWALGAFLLATLLPSRTLQFIAALATIVWMGASNSAFDPQGALVVCVVGEYWAWRRSSRVVATLYAALCVWTLVSEPSLWRQPSTIAPLVVALSMLAFWYGASYKSAMCRGCALVVGGLGLCACATTVYWERMLGAESVAANGSLVLYVITAVGALLFVLFCSHMIFSGANRSAPRFVLGVSLASVWTIITVVSATRKFGVGSAALVLCGAAFCFFILLAAEKRLVNSPVVARLAKNGLRKTTDGAEDDPEFRDPVDEETVASRDEPASAVETAWFTLALCFWRSVCTPALYAVLTLHLALVLVTSL